MKNIKEETKEMKNWVKEKKKKKSKDYGYKKVKKEEKIERRKK